MSAQFNQEFVEGRTGRSNQSFISTQMLLTAALLVSALLLLADLVRVPRELVLDASSIRLDQGFAFSSNAAARSVRFPFTVRSDDLSSPTRSTLIVKENGSPLALGHAAHSVIRDRGGGAYSHWRSIVYFSTPDGSDPRTNGRVYSAAVEISLAPILPATSVLASVVLLVLVLKRESGVRRRLWLDWIMIGSAIVLAGSIMAAATGLVPPINREAGPPKDAALVAGIFGHIAGGMILFVVSVMVAASAGCLMAGKQRASVAECILAGYPLTLVAFALATVIALASPLGRSGAAMFLILVLLPLCRRRLNLAEWQALASPIVKSLPAAILFAFGMALLWHGPTATLQASTQGDLVHSYASLLSLSIKAWPLRHLGSEGDLLPYDNMLPMALGATFLPIPGFDGMLFLTASIAVFFCLWLALGIASLRSLSTDAPGSAMETCLILLTLSAVRTPSFVVESPPVPFMMPLIFSITWLACRDLLAIPRATGVAAQVAVGAALTKVVMLVPLSVLCVFDPLLSLRGRRPNLRNSVVVVLVALLVALYVGRTLATWGASYWNAFEPGPDTRIWLAAGQTHDLVALLAVIARDIGWCVLGYATIKAGPGRLAATYLCAIAINFIYPYLFHTASVFAPLLVAAMLAFNPSRYEPVRNWLLVAAALLVPYPLLRDWAGGQSGWLWLLCIGQIVLFASQGLKLSVMRHWCEKRFPAATVVALALAVPAVANGWLVIDSGWRQGREDVLTPAMFDIWHAVQRQTPDDALIFTDQTGPAFRMVEGWNSYVASGQRQVFIASWVTSFRRFRIDPQARAERLRQNEAVLSGDIPPQNAVLSRDYGGGFFAVMSNSRRPPVFFKKIYGNTELSLYKIESQ